MLDTCSIYREARSLTIRQTVSADLISKAAAGPIRARSSTVRSQAIPRRILAACGCNLLGAHLDITNTTIADNTGTSDIGGLQLVDGGTATIHNTIVADNNGSVTGNIWGNVDTVSSYNLTNTWGSGGLSNTDGHHNIVLDSSVATGLAPLGDYGGPTRTHELTISSPAIDEGSAAYALPNDQRGLARLDVTGAGIDGWAVPDIGAVESPSRLTLSLSPVITVVNPNDDNYADPKADPNGFSLRERYTKLALLPVGLSPLTINVTHIAGAISLTHGTLVVALEVIQ